MHQPELQLPQDPPEITVQPEPEPKEVVVTSRATSIFEEDPEKWIRNNIISKNMSLKAQFLGRMGLGAQATSSLSRESIQRCSRDHARETKQQDKEEASIASTNDSEEELVIDRCYSNLVGDFAINFFKRSDEEVRNRYINRLVGMKILKLEPKKKHQSMLIFDWDDTLLCTHYLARLGFVNLSTEALENLLPVDESASQLLLKAVECGPTLIITNSAEGWVQYSGQLYLPKTYQVIMDKNIKVISARTGYEDAFPGDSHRWKVEAFLNIECLFEKNVVTNLLCLGDSHIEMDAAHILAKKFDQALIKTIKFKEKPKPDELIKQQELVRERLEMIFTSQKNHTIRLEKKVYKQGELC